MKFISIFLICLIIINVYSFKDNNWEYGDNVIIEWKKGNFNRKCQAFSIFQNEKLLKSNIPIINDKIDFGDIDINGIVNLKCDKFVKQKRETLDNDKGMSSEQENEESSIIESEEEDKSIINSIDNSYDPSKENESEKEEEIVNNKNNLSNNESKESNSNNNNNNNNQDNKTSNQDMNNKDKQNLKDKNSSKISANDSDGNYKKNDNNKITNKENEDNDEKSDHNTMDNNNDNNINKSNNKSDNHTKNDTVDKNKNKNNNDINDVNDDDKDKPKDEDEKDEDISLNKTQLITGLSSAFLLTGGMFVSVLKIRKMSDLQLEMNAQEMSADSVYIPSPKLSKASSMSSMEFRSFSSTLQEDTMRSSVSSLIV